MDKRIQELLDPKVLSSISGLELVAKVIVSGYLHGNNHSDRIGIGQEFRQYRTYEPGDDLRLIDWKMHARSERYYIKQAEIETNITVRFIIDASASLLYQEDHLQKIDWIKAIIASLAFLVKEQGDSYGLDWLNDHKKGHITPSNHQKQFYRLLHELVEINTIGKWPVDISSHSLFNPLNKEMILFISDLHQENEELTEFIKKLKTRRNEVIVLQVLGKLEQSLDFDKPYTFEDLETHQRIQTNPVAAKEDYQQRIKMYQEKLRDFFLDNDTYYHLFTMGNPLDELLFQFLLKRKSLL